MKLNFTVYFSAILFSCGIFSHSRNAIYTKTKDSQTTNYTKFSLDSIYNLLNTYLNSYVSKDFDSAHYKNSSIWVIDLVDTLNDSHKSNFYFADNHIYVFAPARVRYVKYDYHNIVIFDSSKIVLFKAVNCSVLGDSIKAVVNYIQKNIESYKDNQGIINRVYLCEHNGLS
jgi:hypothetical protein